MAKHVLKTARQIAEEIRRRAQGLATARGEAIVVPLPTIAATETPTQSGSHWILEASGDAGKDYVEEAALRVARIWDMARR